MHEVEILGHLFEDEQVTREEELALKDGGRWVLGFEGLGSADQRLFAVGNRFLGEVVEDGGLLDAVRDRLMDAAQNHRAVP